MIFKVTLGKHVFCSIPEWNDWHQTAFADSFMMKMEVFKTPD